MIIGNDGGVDGLMGRARAEIQSGDELGAMYGYETRIEREYRVARGT